MFVEVLAHTHTHDSTTVCLVSIGVCKQTCVSRIALPHLRKKNRVFWRGTRQQQQQQKYTLRNTGELIIHTHDFFFISTCQNKKEELHAINDIITLI